MSTTSACPGPGRRGCPYGAVTETRELMGFSFQMMCDRCAAESEEVEAREELERQVRVAESSLRLPARMKDWSFETYPQDAKAKAVVEQATGWLSGYRDGERRNLILHGPVGSGKSGLAVCLLRELAAGGVQGEFAVWRDLLDHLRQSFDDPRMRPNLDALKTRPVVVLDDLGAERPTPWAREQLATVIEFRYQRQLPIIATLNMTLGQYAELLNTTPMSVDEELSQVDGQRIASRLGDGATRIEVNASDRRKGR